MFQVELGHWFYLDLMCEDNQSLPRVPFKVFCQKMFAHVPFLRRHMGQLDEIIEKFRDYKSNVPTYGAIILDAALDKVSLYDLAIMPLNVYYKSCSV